MLNINRLAQYVININDKQQYKQIYNLHIIISHVIVWKVQKSLKYHKIVIFIIQI